MYTLSLMCATADKELDGRGRFDKRGTKNKVQPRQTEGEDVENVDMRRPKECRISLQGKRTSMRPGSLYLANPTH